MGRIILARHGQTYANETRIIDTRPPGAELNDLGKQQALDAGVRLAEIAPNIVAASCSVAIRTQQTAVRMVGAYEKATGRTVPLTVEFGLHEIFSGDFEGQSTPQAHESYSTSLYSWMHGGLDHRMPGGESPREVVQRYQPILERIAADVADTDNDHLIICHGGVMRLVGQNATTIDEKIAYDTYVANCSFIVMEPTGDFGQWTCTMWANQEL